MAEMKRATETFAWSGGMVHWHSEWPADHEVVQQFDQWFETVPADDEADEKPARPAKRAPRKKAAPNG